MTRLLTTISLFVFLAGAARAGEDSVRLGASGYLLKPPPGAKAPPPTIYKTDNVRGPMPTNDWWSSLAWVPFSEPQFAHPLVVKAQTDGLRVFHPSKITANRIGVFAGMPGAKEDCILGHSAAAAFPDARVDGWSDWFVTAAFAADGKSMKLTYGHGSPFVYALYEGGDATVTCPAPPEIWSGDANSAVLGVTINGKPYALFGPSGCAWTGLGTKTLTCALKGKPYFAVALLPEKSPAALDLFRPFACAHVTDSRVTWSFDEASAMLTTEYAVTTKAYEGAETGALLALYPHQWMRTADKLLDYTYPCVRGVMKLARGASFRTQMPFPGVLPSLPFCGGDKAVLTQLVDADAAKKEGEFKDTYWDGKTLGKIATLIPIAEQCGATATKDKLIADLRGRLERWFTALDGGGQPKKRGVFCYDRNWGTLIGYPASYGSDTDLSDHHFHYGYFVKAAAEVARHDPAWAADAQWGGMVKLLVRDIANTERNAADFPCLRNFDIYAGHSWASGKAAFADGNNNESSSEAMNAWAGIILFGQATGDKALRDLGIYLFTTELEGVNQYWFDVENRHRPAQYTPSVVTMVWGAKGVNETWFSNKPSIMHGINWLPFHGGSLYLGLYPEYCRRNYDALVRENGSDKWTDWGDLVVMYRALDNPADALRQYHAAPAMPIEAGNSRTHLYHWIQTLNALGRVDRAVTANYPLYAVFTKDGKRSYVVCNLDAAERAVKFSDGTTVRAAAKSFAVQKP